MLTYKVMVKNIGFALILVSGYAIFGQSQSLYNGALLSVKGSSSLYVSGNFTNASGATYQNDGTVEIKGDISNSQASMAPGNGATTLTGSAVQNISGTQLFEVNNIVFNNTSSGAGNIVLAQNLAIAGAATFTDGIIETGTNKVIFRNGASYSGANDASHVNGWVEKIGNSGFTFPVGDGIKLRTASLTAPATSTDAFSAKYIYSDPNGVHNVLLKDASLNHVSRCEYWIINRTEGSSTPIVTLSFENTYSCGVSLLSDLRVASWDGSKWANDGNQSTTGSVTAGTVTASASPALWSEFTLASTTVENTLPVELIDFKALYNKPDNGVDLLWTTASETNSDYFQVERSINGTDWYKVVTVKASGFSTTVLNYTSFDPSPNKGINYYRLKEVDFNGAEYYSQIEAVEVEQTNLSVKAQPNPFSNRLLLSFYSERAQPVNLIIRNIFGQIMLNVNLDSKAGNNEFNIETSLVSSGTYIAEVRSEDKLVSEKIKIIKIK